MRMLVFPLIVDRDRYYREAVPVGSLVGDPLVTPGSRAALIILTL